MRCLTALLTVAMVAITPRAASAQNVLELHAGLTLAKFGKADGDSDYRDGLSIGAGYYWPKWSETLGLTVGGGYSQKGAEWPFATLQLNYVEISALMTSRVLVAGPLGARFFLGPTIGYETFEDAEVTEPGVAVAVGHDDLDVGVTGGVGAGYDATDNLILTLDLMYHHGLRTLLQDGTQNRAISIEVGVGLALPAVD